MGIIAGLGRGMPGRGAGADRRGRPADAAAAGRRRRGAPAAPPSPPGRARGDGPCPGWARTGCCPGAGRRACRPDAAPASGPASRAHRRRPPERRARPEQAWERPGRGASAAGLGPGLAAGPGLGAAGRAGAAGAAGAPGRPGRPAPPGRAGAAGAVGFAAGCAVGRSAGFGGRLRRRPGGLLLGRAGQQGAPYVASNFFRGSSTVEDADLTNSPIAFSFSSASLLEMPYFLASSETRVLATILLLAPDPSRDPL